MVTLTMLCYVRLLVKNAANDGTVGALRRMCGGGRSQQRHRGAHIIYRAEQLLQRLDANLTGRMPTSAGGVQ